MPIENRMRVESCAHPPEWSQYLMFIRTISKDNLGGQYQRSNNPQGVKITTKKTKKNCLNLVNDQRHYLHIQRNIHNIPEISSTATSSSKQQSGFWHKTLAGEVNYGKGKFFLRGKMRTKGELVDVRGWMGKWCLISLETIPSVQALGLNQCRVKVERRQMFGNWFPHSPYRIYRRIV